MRCRWQQGRGFSSLPQPIKRNEALKNDVESGGAEYAGLVFVASTQSTPHPTLTCRPLPQGERLNNARGLNEKGGDKSTPPFFMEQVQLFPTTVNQYIFSSATDMTIKQTYSVKCIISKIHTLSGSIFTN